MELSEIKSMWQAYDSKLEKAVTLNLRCIELIQTQKVKSKLAPIFWQRIVEITFHAIAIFLLLLFLSKNFFQLPYAVCAIALLVFYIIAVIMCIRQIIIIRQMDYSNDIVTIQSSLVMLQTHMVNYTRVAVLCIPTFLAYPIVVSKAIRDFDLKFLSFMDVSSQYQGNWWTVQLISSIILIPLCIWFYREVTYKNIHKKWVKDTIQKTAGTRIAKAIEFIKELETLKHGVI